MVERTIKMNPIEFFKRWKEGIKNLTPAQLLKAELAGYMGNMVGMTFALVFLLFNGMWYFTIFMIFTTFLQLVAYISTKQRYDTLMSFADMAKEKPVDSEELLKKLR